MYRPFYFLDMASADENKDTQLLSKETENDKLARVEGECFVLEEYFIPKSEERLIRPDVDNGNVKKEKKEKKRKEKRPVLKISWSERLCNSRVDLAPGEDPPDCGYTNCKMQHDVPQFLASKPPDAGPECYVFSTFGYCPRGVTCRFGSSHLDAEGRNVMREDAEKTKNKSWLTKQDQTQLRKKQYDFSLADSACQASWDIINSVIFNRVGKKDEAEADAEEEEEAENIEPPEKKMKAVGPVSDEDLVKLRQVEKKQLDWTGKTYLAPLTTVGNLPFRRVCKGLGADITCGEMALGLQLLQGHGAEWALTKKHESEDFFGVQVCGCSPPQMARVAQLCQDKIDCDFVDINMGCPIDLIYQKGMGSGLMARKRPLENIVRTMSSILTKPLTIKMRTGIYTEKRIAHDVFPLVEQWGVSAITLHGRSREQRYTRLADWDYIGECARTVEVPVFGNGDVLNYEDYNAAMEKGKVAGIMLARGALIKPWLFTEIKEQRHWDISGQERLDIVKNFCNFGLEHWGSDDKGVENTRKFLLGKIPDLR